MTKQIPTITYMSDPNAEAYQVLLSRGHFYSLGKAFVVLVSMGMTAGLALSISRLRSIFLMYQY